MPSNGLFRPLTPVSIAFTILLACGLSQAQEAKELARHPGDTIKFEVKFDGPDAAKIRTVSLYLQRRGPAPANQAGFDGGFRGKSFPAIADAFHPEITIPDNAMTGDYFLSVSAAADTGNVPYTAGEQFQMHNFRIENPKTLTPPKITIKELP